MHDIPPYHLSHIQHVTPATIVNVVIFPTLTLQYYITQECFYTTHADTFEQCFMLCGLMRFQTYMVCAFETFIEEWLKSIDWSIDCGFGWIGSSKKGPMCNSGAGRVTSVYVVWCRLSADCRMFVAELFQSPTRILHAGRRDISRITGHIS